MKSARKYLLLALAIVVVDQIVKVIVKLNMDLGERIPLLGEWFKIQFIENPGAAFGLRVTSFFGGMSEETGKIILTLFSLLALAGIVYFMIKMATHKSAFPWFLAMILGGALGNIIDRTLYGLIFSDINAYEGGLFFGRVVDMFYFDLFDLPLPEFLGGGTYHLWPIFNVADAAITVGILVVLIFQGKFARQHELATQGPADLQKLDPTAVVTEKVSAAAAEAATEPASADPADAADPSSAPSEPSGDTTK